MLIIESYEIAVLLCFITMICWGSWANTQKLASKSWAFPLYYWDYSIGVILFSLIFGLTFGSFGENGRSFFDDLYQGSSISFFNAFLGGIIFNIANLLIVAAISIAGMAVAFPIGIGIALILGVIVNYVAAPIGNPIILFSGVAVVTIAILIDAIAYKRLSISNKKTSSKGIIISILGGILMGFFYRFVASSIITNFDSPEPGLLSPYSAVFIFSLGIFISNFLWNTYFMYNPIEGNKSSYSDYITKGNLKLHLIGILGGVIWCIGMSLSMISSEKAGYAISYGLGQGATMIAAAWGVFIWKEFKHAPKGTNNLITVMFCLFVLGLTLIIFSRFY